jgi:hypothetical protein
MGKTNYIGGVPNIIMCVINNTNMVAMLCEVQTVLVPFTVMSWNFCGDMSFNEIQILLR